MSIKKTKKNSVPIESKEPIEPYVKTEVQFFSSFEEMNIADLKGMAALSPLQRLSNITYFLSNMYPNQSGTEAGELQLIFGE